MQLEDTLAQVRKEYEMLRIEFEQTLAANEQAGMEFFCYVSCFFFVVRFVFLEKAVPLEVALQQNTWCDFIFFCFC